MGRTLDTLKHGNAHRAAPAPKSPPAADATAPEDCVVDWTLQEEVPYVEVGSPDKTIEMSPNLVKHPPQPKTQPPHPQRGKTLAGPKGAPVADLTDARPMTVAFEAWPRPAGVCRVAPEIIAYHAPAHRVSLEYAALFDKMVPSLTPAAPQVFMLCGLHPRVGTSTVLLNLAVVAAQRSRRVAVLDLNLARPGLGARLGQAGLLGLPDVLAGSLAVGQAMVTTSVANLSLLPAGTASEASGLLTAEASGWFMAWIRERYDVIAIDGPCVDDAAGLAVLAPHADGTYLVLPENETGGAPRGIAQAIARTGGRLRGLIHTHFEP
jgi:Mrp family chromosome partitioning ATPase